MLAAKLEKSSNYADGSPAASTSSTSRPQHLSMEKYVHCVGLVMVKVPTVEQAIHAKLATQTHY